MVRADRVQVGNRIVMDIMPERMLGVADGSITVCPGAYPAITISYVIIVDLHILLYAIAF